MLLRRLVVVVVVVVVLLPGVPACPAAPLRLSTARRLPELRLELPPITLREGREERVDDLLVGELMLFLVAGVRREDFIGLNTDFEDLDGVFLTTIRFLGVALILLCLTRVEDGRR